ncbi:hypothetical protein PDE_04780 [Penicillium oxalicum 114-2]|uniref:NB-ARC domain-containing protein n=1 Tax=Penicillium oxalicum (strain 114-2 / CGMCC 5302) TaxID=933388 RepID=S7ZGQ6_PENO1|nr:hypothetical protein PDE_04780 [Penicillium oxalicum 114-2]
MEKQLDELHKRLFKAKARAERTMAVLIAGVPGSGKTHLARQYVFTQLDCYSGGVFWVDAKSRESIHKCFWEIAQAAALIEQNEADEPEYKQSQTYVDAVRNWLQSRHEWLLIFDGILFDHDDDINKFRSFLPWSKRCSIIYTSITSTLRKKQRLFEPYCLSVPRLKVEDACKLLYRDLGIRRPTAEQCAKATELVEYYECLPLAIHAIGHRLNATGKRIERYRVKHQVTDKKLAEPFLSIMNDLYRLNQREALNLINLLSFLSHQVPVGLLLLGRSIMTAENAEILSSAQSGEEPDLDTTLGTLINYGLVERTSELDMNLQQISSSQYSSDEMQVDPRLTPQLTDSFTGSSQDGFFSLYRSSSGVDIVKVHSVVQGFCRDELKIKDEDHKDIIMQTPGFYDSWLIVATRFLCRSYEMAKERMAHYNDCGLVRDYREYETQASRLAELFPRKPAMENHPPVLREARETLKQLMKSVSNEIDRMSPSSSQESTRNQKSVFDRSSSSSSSFPESSADEGGLSRESTWNFTESGSVRAASPEEMMRAPAFRLELFPPHVYHHAESGSDDGYETDGDDANEAPKISPALSQISQNTERPRDSPASHSPPIPYNGIQDWQLAQSYSHIYSAEPAPPSQKSRGPRRLRSPPLGSPLVEISPIEGRGSSSRASSEQGRSPSVSGSTAESALAAVRRMNGSQSLSGQRSLSGSSTSPTNAENAPPYAKTAAKRTADADDMSIRRPPSSSTSGNSDVQSEVHIRSSEDLPDSHPGRTLGSPLARELMSHDILTDPPSRPTYRETDRRPLTQSLGALDLYGTATSGLDSRRPSLQANLDLTASASTLIPYTIPTRNVSASTPSLLQYPPPLLPVDHDISITITPKPSLPQHVTRGAVLGPPVASTPAKVAHPSAILPGSLPLSMAASDSALMGESEQIGSEPLSRGSSTFSTQSCATEPVRSPPQFSPPSFFVGPAQSLSASSTQWVSAPVSDGHVGALPSEQVYALSGFSRGRIGSVDERIIDTSQEWVSDLEPGPLLPVAGHRLDVRDPRLRLHGVRKLQTPRNIPSYRLLHPNISGPIIPGHEQAYLPTQNGSVPPARPRSGSSPAKPNYAYSGPRA